MEETALSDFGDDGFRPSLDRFVEILRLPTQSAPDKVAAYGQMVNVLSWRLRMIADRKRYPAIEEERIVAPLIVIGFPRCGTTLLHALLTECPGNRAPLWWELARPSPPPSLAPAGDPRMGQATRDMERWLAEYPGFLTQHPYHDAGGGSSMECEALMVHDLRNAYPMLLSKVPFFTPWADNSDPVASYRAHHALLQHLQYGAPPRRWVLKGVEHQYRLGPLAEPVPGRDVGLAASGSGAGLRLPACRDVRGAALFRGGHLGPARFQRADAGRLCRPRGDGDEGPDRQQRSGMPCALFRFRGRSSGHDCPDLRALRARFRRDRASGAVLAGAIRPTDRIGTGSGATTSPTSGSPRTRSGIGSARTATTSGSEADEARWSSCMSG